MIHGACVKLTLDDDDLPFLVIDDDSIKLFVIRAVRNVISSLRQRAKITAPKIPSEKLLPFVGKILLIVRITFEIRPYSFNKCRHKACLAKQLRRIHLTIYNRNRNVTVRASA